MKKFLITLLAITYLGVSSGIAFNIHYCMGKIASVDMMSHSDKCGKCGMKTKSGCCKDEFKIIKLDDLHKPGSNPIYIFSPVDVVINSDNFVSPKLHFAEVNSDYNNHSPPLSQGTSLRILNCVFII